MAVKVTIGTRFSWRMLAVALNFRMNQLGDWSCMLKIRRRVFKWNLKWAHSSAGTIARQCSSCGLNKGPNQLVAFTWRKCEPGLDGIFVQQGALWLWLLWSVDPPRSSTNHIPTWILILVQCLRIWKKEGRWAIFFPPNWRTCHNWILTYSNRRVGYNDNDYQPRPWDRRYVGMWFTSGIGTCWTRHAICVEIT
jgi:hypothetical protein